LKPRPAALGASGGARTDVEARLGGALLAGRGGGAQGDVLPFYGAQAREGTPAQAAAPPLPKRGRAGSAGPRWASAGLRLGRGAGRARVEPTGSAQTARVVFFFFPEFISNAKTIPENIQKLFKGTKITPKITKIPGKFLGID
jgi:hypothetical protein